MSCLCSPIQCPLNLPASKCGRELSWPTFLAGTMFRFIVDYHMDISTRVFCDNTDIDIDSRKQVAFDVSGPHSWINEEQKGIWVSMVFGLEPQFPGSATGQPLDLNCRVWTCQPPQPYNMNQVLKVNQSPYLLLLFYPPKHIHTCIYTNTHIRFILFHWRTLTKAGPN